MTEQNCSLICLFLGVTSLLVSRLVDQSISRKGESITPFERRMKLVYAGIFGLALGLFTFFDDRSTRQLSSSRNVTVEMSLFGLRIDQFLFVGVIATLFVVTGFLISMGRNDIAVVIEKGPEIISESTVSEKSFILQVVSRIFIAAGITGCFWLVFQLI